LKTSEAAVRRFFKRHAITFKEKRCTQPNKTGPM
jgi:hypothetical protein